MSVLPLQFAPSNVITNVHLFLFCHFCCWCSFSLLWTTFCCLALLCSALLASASGSNSKNVAFINCQFCCIWYKIAQTQSIIVWTGKRTDWLTIQVWFIHPSFMTMIMKWWDHWKESSDSKTVEARALKSQGHLYPTAYKGRERGFEIHSNNNFRNAWTVNGYVFIIMKWWLQHVCKICIKMVFSFGHLINYCNNMACIFFLRMMSLTLLKILSMFSVSTAVV